MVLNSCSSGRSGTNDLFSGTAAALARSGIGAVAAMQFTISDTAAIAFARGFYTAIAHGRNVRGSEVASRAQQTFEEAVGRVRPAVEGVIAQLRSLAETPDEVHVEFGLDLHAEAGAFIAAASTTANFTIALTWRRSAGVPEKSALSREHGPDAAGDAQPGRHGTHEKHEVDGSASWDCMVGR